jgi:hypothetical protein
MAASQLANNIGKVVTNTSNLIGTLQVGVNKILWGAGNKEPIMSTKYDTVSGSFSTTSNIPQNPTPPKGNLLNSGLFNALDALNEVDLCNVLTYAFDNINIKKKPRPPRPWNASQEALYFLQDQAAFVQQAIDKYTAYPTEFVGSYIGTGPNAVPPAVVATGSNEPAPTGTEAQKFNLFFLMKAIKETFATDAPGTGSLFTSEDVTLLRTVPGLGGNLNVIDDFIGTINKYSDYRNIPNEDLQNLINKIATIRSVCVTIQNLDFKSALALVGNFLGIDIRSQIQKLGKFIDVTKLIPTLKGINSGLQGFIKIAQQVQGILSLGQFIIKLALLFYKIFKFIILFFDLLALPLLFGTAGSQTKLQDVKDKAKDESVGVIRLLKAVNGLLSVLTSFIRYLLTNANELLIRLRLLLVQLEGCQAVKDSDVILQLQQTERDLIAVRDQLANFIRDYDSKTNPNNALFGTYDIRVVEEELVDRSIPNKRRRGIALDTRGNIVTQSDLTFATNTNLIIEEVKQKLLALQLVQPALGVIDPISLPVISESLNFLENNDVLQNDLNIDTSESSNLTTTLEGLNVNTDQGLGLNAFINDLKGGKKLRERTKTKVAEQSASVKAQVSSEINTSKQTLKTSN